MWQASHDIFILNKIIHKSILTFQRFYIINESERKKVGKRNNKKVEMSTNNGFWERCVNDLTILRFLHKMPSFLRSYAPFLVGTKFKNGKRLGIKIEKWYVDDIFTINYRWQVITGYYYWGKKVILMLGSNLNK